MLLAAVSPSSGSLSRACMQGAKAGSAWPVSSVRPTSKVTLRPLAVSVLSDREEGVRKVHPAGD